MIRADHWNIAKNLCVFWLTVLLCAFEYCFGHDEIWKICVLVVGCILVAAGCSIVVEDYEDESSE